MTANNSEGHPQRSSLLSRLIWSWHYCLHRVSIGVRVWQGTEAVVTVGGGVRGHSYRPWQLRRRAAKGTGGRRRLRAQCQRWLLLRGGLTARIPVFFPVHVFLRPRDTLIVQCFVPTPPLEQFLIIYMMPTLVFGTTDGGYDAKLNSLSLNRASGAVCECTDDQFILDRLFEC